MTTNFSSGLEKLIRTRATLLIGPWPKGLTLFVNADETGFNVSLGPVQDEVAVRYRSRVAAIINDIKLECRLFSLRKRAAEVAQRGSCTPEG